MPDLSAGARMEDKPIRKLIYSHHVSLDGFIEGPNGELDWICVDEELYRRFNELEGTIDSHLYGRRTWEAMAPVHSVADRNPSAPDYVIESARIWQRKPKVVFSRTLAAVEGNATLVRSQIREEIVRLKEQPGTAMCLAGADLASSVIPLGLIDEYWLYVNPVAVGGGKPMFPRARRDSARVPSVSDRMIAPSKQAMNPSAAGVIGGGRRLLPIR